jgi:hypothetical protein
MVWTIRNSLNRWCLRSLMENGESPVCDHLRKFDEASAIVVQPPKGRPPLMNACIAPHCDSWNPVDDCSGVCQIFQRARMAMHKKSTDEEPTAAIPTTPLPSET